MITIVKKIIKAIRNDLETDAKAIKDIATGKVDKELLKERLSVFRDIKFYGMLFFILLCLTASFVLGWAVSAKYYEVQANNLVNEVVADAQAYCMRNGAELLTENYTFKPIFNSP